MRDRTHKTRRRGITLVELLMVVAIIALLMAVAIPLTRPAFQDRKVREASRTLNAMLNGARARAAETGRPVGVWIERTVTPGDLVRLNDTSGTVTQVEKDVIASRMAASRANQIYMAEVGPSYTGATLGSVATVELPAPNATVGVLRFWLPVQGQLQPPSPPGYQPSPLDDSFLRQLIQPGETFTIRFDHKGRPYPCERDTSPNGPFFINLGRNGMPRGAQHPGSAPAPADTGLPYEITRGPVRSSVTPVAMPGDTVIDLTISGVGIDGTELRPLDNSGNVDPFVASSPVILLFAPSGELDFVFVGDRSFRPLGAVHLFIGRDVQTINPDPSVHNYAQDDPPSNLADASGIWVTISHRTGAVTTAENTDTTQLRNANPPPTLVQLIAAARRIARDSVRMGGR